MAKYKLRTLESHSRVMLRPELRDIQFLISDRPIFELPPSYQRWYDEWAAARVDSYILDVHDGLGIKDLFLIADIGEILKNSDPSEPEYEYFQKLWDDGKRYIIIDGQHRFYTLNYYVTGYPTGELHMVGTNRETEYLIDGDLNITVNNKTFDELPLEIKEHFLGQEIVITFIDKCNLKELKGLFVKSNSGTPLTKQEKRAAANSPVAAYIQEWFGPRGHADYIGMFDGSLSAINGDYRKVKRGYELIGAELFDWERHPSTVVNHDTLDKFYNVDDIESWEENEKSVKGKESKQWKSVMKIMVDGLKTIKKINLGEFRDYYYFTSYMMNSKHAYNDGNVADGVKIKNPKVWCETLWKIYQELHREENNWVLKPDEPKLDADGNVNFLPHPSTGKPMTTRGCFRGLHGSNGPTQIRLRIDAFKEEFNSKYKSELINSGVITYLHGGRVFSKPKKLGKLVSNKMRDGITDRELTVTQATTPGRLHGDHKVRYKDGGDLSGGNLAVTLSENNLKRG